MMSFHTGFNVKFLFHSFASSDSSKGIYYLGLVFTIILSMLVIMSRSFKKSLLRSKSSHMAIAGVEMFIKFGAGLEMLLLMTFNYGVVTCIILGSSIGYLLGLNMFKKKSDCDDACDMKKGPESNVNFKMLSGTED